MSFIEDIFPDYLGFGSVGGPGYSTEVITVASGRESRNQKWLYERHRYDISMTARQQSERDAINAFFRRARGRAIGFRFRDHAEYKASNVRFGTGTGAQTAFQLRIPYVVGATTEYREIYKPRAGAVVKVNGVVTSVTLNTATGMVTFSAAPAAAAVLTWVGEFDVPVRFEQDILRWRIVDNAGSRPGAGGDDFMFVPEALSVIETREIA